MLLYTNFDNILYFILFSQKKNIKFNVKIIIEIAANK